MSAPAAPAGSELGRPRVHYRVTDSTNERARRLAARGAPHGTLVTAAEQTAGRGRHGRAWTAAPGRALLCSLVIREPPPMLSLIAGVAVAEAIGAGARVKWPNDVLVGSRKVAGILVEGLPQERWAVLGIGVNVALEENDFPPQLCGRAGTLGLSPADIEPLLERVLERLDAWLRSPPAAMLEQLRARDALRGRRVRWSLAAGGAGVAAGGAGVAAGIDADGRLIVVTGRGRLTLEAGEVHLE